MKNYQSKNLRPGKYLSAALLVFALSAVIAAQNTFRIGDSVTVSDGRTGQVESIKDQEMAKVKFGDGNSQYFMLQDIKKAIDPNAPTFRVGDKVAVKSTNQEGVILELAARGDGAKVQTGPGKYNFQWVLFTDLITPQQAATVRDQQKDEIRRKPVRAQFEDEARPFLGVVKQVAVGYDPKYRLTTAFHPDAATYSKWTSDLTALAGICQKYPNLTSRPGAFADDISQNVADWCRIAEQRTKVVQRMQIIVGEQRVATDIQVWSHKIDDALRSREGYVKYAVQELLYDRDAWEEKELKYAKKIYADAGSAMPADAYAALDKKVEELKAKINIDAPTRSWTPPPYTDAGLEATVRKAYPSVYPGAKVYKTGMTFTTWKPVDDVSLIDSGTDYKVFKTTFGAYRYKLGLALVKLPKQPFCQIRDFQFTQHKSGAGYSAGELRKPMGSTGIFVKCP